MSIAIQYSTDFSAAGFTGLSGYFDYFQSTYSSPGHASNMWFHNNPGSLNIGGTTYNDTYFGIKVIGEDLANTSTSSNVSFLVKAAEVTLENGAGTHYQSADMIYTAANGHDLAGEISELIFGNGAYSSGSLASTLFTVTNLTPHIGNGYKDIDSDGAYDAVEIPTAVGVNKVHDLILNLMGGATGGAGGTSVLEGYLAAYGTTQTGVTGNYDEVFSSYGGDDTFTGNGGNDAFRFEAGFGNDVITDFINSSGSVSERDLISFKTGVFGGLSAADILDPLNGYYSYSGGVSVISDGTNSITLTGALTTADINFFA